MAAKKGARATASDINVAAVRNAAANASQNQVQLHAVHSDLFGSIPAAPFDWIVINPPYYPADPQSDEAHAWYCGRNHEYFTRLFSGLGSHTHDRSFVLIVLADVCNLELIFSIADKAGFYFEKLDERKVWTDGKNYLFRIKVKR